MKKKRILWSLAPIGLAILYLLINHYGSEFLDGPKAIPFSSSPVVGKTCPTNLSFDYKGSSQFAVGFLNRGGTDGTFTVNINSQDVLTKTQDPNAKLDPSSSLSWVVLKDSQNPIYFNFVLNMTDVSKPPPTISIGMTLQCTANIGPVQYTCQGITESCNYVRNVIGSYDLH